ncbi:MAG: serine hydrolase, partial [Lachnospiraceae bacterium]|nr:serine hydrolase [Lachnospiraceae bacterium]
LIDYLKPRLFDKIGIDAANLKCICMEDGMEMGGGGLYATTEDNLRMMKLYADGGVWEGERILSEEYVKLATSLQNESATERAVNPPAEDNFVGYGFQIWMCRPEGVYRADGAMGQFTIVFPKYNMLLAITENASGSTGGVMPQKALDTIWEWYYSLPAPEVTSLPENEAASAHLKRRMSMLALPRPNRSPISPL